MPFPRLVGGRRPFHDIEAQIFWSHVLTVSFCFFVRWVRTVYQRIANASGNAYDWFLAEFTDARRYDRKCFRRILSNARFFADTDAA